jgi:RNA polymerase sigma-70 factor (sigma-E family)
MHWLRSAATRRDFERFVAERTDQLLRTAFLLAGDAAEAEDLVQETLLRVARHWPRVAAMEYPGAYARQILVNLALRDRGRRARRSVELAAPPGAPALDLADRRAEDDLRTVDARAELIAALNSLPARQRAVIVLRYWDELPEAEVAALLGCSVGTVKSTASRALARLREATAGHHDPQPLRRSR